MKDNIILWLQNNQTDQAESIFIDKIKVDSSSAQYTQCLHLLSKVRKDKHIQVYKDADIEVSVTNKYVFWKGNFKEVDDVGRKMAFFAITPNTIQPPQTIEKLKDIVATQGRTFPKVDLDLLLNNIKHIRKRFIKKVAIVALLVGAATLYFCLK